MFCDLLKDMSSVDWNQWLDDLMEDIGDLSSSDDLSSLEDSFLYDLLKDMSPDDWAQVAEDSSFDLDAFVAPEDIGDLLEDRSSDEGIDLIFDLDDFVL